MRSNRFPVTFLVLFTLLVSCSRQQSLEEAKSPNIIIILADDLGYGDVSFFNPDSKIRTENIDSLARSGISFTDVHSISYSTISRA